MKIGWNSPPCSPSATPHRRGWGRMLGGLLLTWVVAQQAHAGLIVSGRTVNVGFNSVNNRLEFAVTNTGANAVSLNGFTLAFTADSPALTLIDVTNDNLLQPYIFRDHSLFGPSLIDPTLPPGPLVIAADLYDVVNEAIVIAPGQTKGLGVLLFDAPGERTTVTLVFDPDITSLSLDDDPVPSAELTLVNGRVTVTPEPAGILLAGGGALALAWIARRRRRPATAIPA